MGSGNGANGNPQWLELLKSHYAREIPPKVKRFFTAYVVETACDATAAAKLVGYRHPNTQGPKLTKKFPDVADACREAWRDACGVKPDELVMHLAEIVRDPDHKDRMKAIELNAKVHGMLTEKTVIELDRTKLLRQIDERIAQLTQARAVDVGVEIPALPAATDQEPGSST